MRAGRWAGSHVAIQGHRVWRLRPRQKHARLRLIVQKSDGLIRPRQRCACTRHVGPVCQTAQKVDNVASRIDKSSHGVVHNGHRFSASPVRHLESSARRSRVPAASKYPAPVTPRVPAFGCIVDSPGLDQNATGVPPWKGSNWTMAALSMPGRIDGRVRALGRVATTESEGRYALTNVPAGTRLGLIVARRHQPCAAVTTVAADTVLESRCSDRARTVHLASRRSCPV